MCRAQARTPSEQNSQFTPKMPAQVWSLIATAGYPMTCKTAGRPPVGPVRPEAETALPLLAQAEDLRSLGLLEDHRS